MDENKTINRRIDDELRKRIAYWEGITIGQNINLKYAIPGTQREEAAQAILGYAENEIAFLNRMITLHDESKWRYEE